MPLGGFCKNDSWSISGNKILIVFILKLVFLFSSFCFKNKHSTYSNYFLTIIQRLLDIIINILLQFVFAVSAVSEQLAAALRLAVSIPHGTNICTYNIQVVLPGLAVPLMWI